jgi:DNA polymerase III subunit epsilon
MDRRQAVVKWAAELLEHDFVCLDTESTGLGDRDEPCEITVLNGRDGTIMFDSLIKPTVPIGDGARQIHGITAEMVADKPTMAGVYGALFYAIGGKVALCYNAAFDRRMISNGCIANRIPNLASTSHWQCLMEEYSRYRGLLSRYGGYKWARLEEACWEMGIDVNGTHRAADDVRLTLELLRKVAGE